MRQGPPLFGALIFSYFGALILMLWTSSVSFSYHRFSLQIFPELAALAVHRSCLWWSDFLRCFRSTFCRTSTQSRCLRRIRCVSERWERGSPRCPAKKQNLFVSNKKTNTARRRGTGSISLTVLLPYVQLSRLAPSFWEAFYWRKCWAQGAKDGRRA